VELVVRIIRTYIAEHRSIFEKRPDCLRVLRELLDLFITAGSPSGSGSGYIPTWCRMPILKNFLESVSDSAVFHTYI
jgi:hypothetical protein